MYSSKNSYPPNLYILAPNIPVMIVDTANINREVTICKLDTFPIDTLTNIAIKDVNGINEATFNAYISGFVRPIIEIKKATINTIVSGVELVPTSSVLDTKAPMTP